MRKKSHIVLLLLFGAVACLAQIPAFPGAEGAGQFTKGGRGGVIIEVTNLNDSGPGSLRAAVDTYGPRIVVFRVSGTIQLLSDLNIRFPYITIAGQTAPGDGICLRDRQVVVNANEVILRYLRFRLGDETGVETDAIWGRYRKNIIIDHCSASWSVDEAMSFYGNDSLTVQWCIISESLYLSNHSKGAHGYGGIWGGRNASFHHNLIAHHSSRTPRFSGGETSACENVDFRNNVIYNWGFNSAYGGEGGTINMVANYYKSGPATKSGVRYRIVQPSNANGKWYIEDNYVSGSPTITANNWAGGVQGSFASASISRITTPHPFIPITQQTAEQAYYLVLDNAGAAFPRRDAVDSRIIYDVQNGVATFDGHGYEALQGISDTSLVRGIIDSQRDVGGWPELSSVTPPEDGDHDAMPDEWELEHGLNPNDKSDRNSLTEDGYTMVEVYLNSLTGAAAAVDFLPLTRPSTYSLNQNFPNPFNTVTTVSFTLPSPGQTEVVVYDVTGRALKQLVKGWLAAGLHHIAWDGLNGQAKPAASGIYICEAYYQKRRQVIKMQLVR